MKKQLLAMFLAMGLLASGIPHTAWAKNPEDNVKTLDSAVDVQQALHANGPEAKGTKENVSDTQEQVSARVIFKNHILPEKTYGAIEKFYYSAGEYYILKYQNGEAAKEAVKKLKGDYPGTLVVQDRIVSIKTEDEPLKLKTNLKQKNLKMLTLLLKQRERRNLPRRTMRIPKRHPKAMEKGKTLKKTPKRRKTIPRQKRAIYISHFLITVQNPWDWTN